MADFEEAAERLRNADLSFVDRTDAVKELSRMGTPQAVEVLAEVVGDSERMVREEAVRALGKIATPETVPALIKVLETGEESMQRYAAEALGEMRAGEAWEALQSAAASSSWSLQSTAKNALEKIGDPPKAKRPPPVPADEMIMQLPSTPAAAPERMEPAGILRKAIEGTDYALKERTAGEKYSVVVPLPGGRSQKVYVTIGGTDSDGAGLICIYTVCGPATPKNYEWALRRNMKISFGSFALADHSGKRMFVMVNTLLAEATEPVELQKSIDTLARHGDQLEELLTGKDVR